MKRDINPNMISILVPVFNEEEAIHLFIPRMLPVVEQIKTEFDMQVELVFTDNASSDRTFPILQEYAQKIPYLNVYRFSRNFGFQRSIMSGYALCKGAACVQIDVDLEDPPELILEFIKKWKEGYKVVYGKRKRRHESWLMKSARGVFYKCVDLLSEYEVPIHAGDFRLIDRRIIDIICSVNDAEPYLRGLIASLGFEQYGVEYDRDARVAGESSFSTRSYISLATEGILQSSIRPLNLSLYFCFGVLICSILLAGFYIASSLLGYIPEEAHGFATIVVLGLFQFAFLLFVIGINSLYLGRVYRQVFKRPVSIVHQSSDNIDKFERNATYWPGEPYSEIENKEPLKEVRKRNNKKSSQSTS